MGHTICLFAYLKKVSIFAAELRGKLPRGLKSPILLSKGKAMVNKEQIRKQVQEHISGTGIFLVDVRLSSTGRLTVLIDRHEGVTIDDCASLSRWISQLVCDEAGDIELNVSSPGLDMPFTVIEQYRKNEGRMVEVEDLEGKKQKGLLSCVTTGGFDLVTEKRQKGKEPESVTAHYNYDETRAVKVVISFK